MKEVIEQQRSYTAIKNVMSDFLSHCRYEKRLSEKTIKAYKVDGLQFETFVNSDFNVTYFEHITAYSGGYPFSISGDIRSVPS